jgi:hypothetical protein
MSQNFEIPLKNYRILKKRKRGPGCNLSERQDSILINRVPVPCTLGVYRIIYIYIIRGTRYCGMWRRTGVHRIVYYKGYEVLWYGEERGSIPYYYIL